MPLISVIIPVFNTETHLYKCIDSVLNQDFEDFELILIDDGSTDSSFKICKEYEKNDQRIRAFSQENAGPSNARNKGICCASGEYISFIDADDYIDRDYLSQLIKYKCDFVASGIKQWYADGNKTFFKPYSSLQKTNAYTKEFLKAVYETESTGLISSPCCKLYKKSIILDNDLRFDTSLTYGEDHIFNINYLLHIQNLVLIPYIGYTYTHYGKTSLTNRLLPYKELNRYCNLLFEIRKVLNEKLSSSEYECFNRKDYIYRFWQCVSVLYFSKLSPNLRKKEMKLLLMGAKTDVFVLKELPIHFKVLCVLFNLFPFSIADYLAFKLS